VLQRFISSTTNAQKHFTTLPAAASALLAQGCGIGLDVSVSRRTNVSSRSLLGLKLLRLVYIPVLAHACGRPVP